MYVNGLGLQNGRYALSHAIGAEEVVAALRPGAPYPVSYITMATAPSW
jgi:hypothetical protein